MTQLEAYLAGLQRFGIRPGLERIAALLQRSGHPDAGYPVVLVGGTNGKGSTCQFLATMLAAAGKRIGLYTSPHLYRWNERVRVIDTAALAEAAALFPGAATDAELDALLREGRPHIEAVTGELGQPTEFEILTWLGLWHFARQGVDAAVVEVGLGGRWDATNATAPVVSVITHVALDHCDRLGDTVEAIAADKVEIARRGRILVTAETKPAVLEVFRAHCERHEVRLWPWRRPDWSNDDDFRANPPPAPPPGDKRPDFQIINHGTASVAHRALATTIPGWHKEPAPIAGRSLMGRQVPGRMEVVRRQPIVVLDGANNPDGAERLAAALRRTVEQAGGRLILVLGILADKDYAAMVHILAPGAAAVVATQSSSPRAVSAEAVAEAARRWCGDVTLRTPVQAAMDDAMAMARPSDVVCVTGSFYTLAEVDRTAIGADDDKS